MKKLDNRGFTIVELLIATAVFSVILLIITGAIIQVGRLYYKGLTMSRTQEVTRTIVEDVSRAIQFTPGVVYPDLANAGSSDGKCVGLHRYSFIMNTQVDRENNKRALMVDNVGGSCTAAQDIQPPSPFTAVAGSEMLADKMRLNKFDVTANPVKPGSWIVTVKVIYGDDDLLCRPGTASNGATCDNGIQLPAGDLVAGDVQCKNIRSGSGFCAVSELSTIVERRLQ